jgi:hypothetical protein
VAVPAVGRVSFKNRVASEQGRPDIARRRLVEEVQGRIDPRRLVFIDETWAKTNMTRTCGWNRRGLPLNTKVPHGRWTTMTFLAGLRHARIAASCVSSTGRSMVAASSPTSNNASFRHCSVETLSSWTTSAATREYAPPFVRPSKALLLAAL